MTEPSITPTEPIVTATYVREITGWRGDARLYRLSTPVPYDEIGRHIDDDLVPCTTDHVIVSAVYAMFSGPETYIFPATADGDAINYLEMTGSFQGDLDHERALVGAGFTLAPEGQER